MKAQNFAALSPQLRKFATVELGSPIKSVGIHT